MKGCTNDFGKYLRNVRKQRKLTIRQLEDKSGISNAYISQLETGERDVPMPEVIRKLSAALDIPYEDMMREAGHLDQDNKGGGSMKGCKASDIRHTQLTRHPVFSFNIEDHANAKTLHQVLFEWLQERPDYEILSIQFSCVDRAEIAHILYILPKAIESNESPNEVEAD